MRVLNTDAKYYLAKTPNKCLYEAAREKKKMYLEACLLKRRHFSSFFSSIIRIMYVEAATTLKRIAICLATNWHNPTQGRVDMPRIGFPSLWCGPHTGTSGGPDFRNIISA